MGRAVLGWRRGTAELEPAVVEEYWKHSFGVAGRWPQPGGSLWHQRPGSSQAHVRPI